MSTTSPSFEDRAAGALLGAFIGDALGLGPHWYYDLDELRANYGPWINGYTDPKPDRYHAGMKAGQLSQAGIILEMTLRSLVECGGYDEADFCRRMDDELFPQLNGQPMSGPGATPASPSAKLGVGECNKDCRGANLPVMPIPPKPSSARWRSRFATPKARTNLPSASAATPPSRRPTTRCSP